MTTMYSYSIYLVYQLWKKFSVFLWLAVPMLVSILALKSCQPGVSRFHQHDTLASIKLVAVGPSTPQQLWYLVCGASSTSLHPSSLHFQSTKYSNPLASLSSSLLAQSLVIQPYIVIIPSSKPAMPRQIFKGCVIAIAGPLPGQLTIDNIRHWTELRKGRFSEELDDEVTHLLCTSEQFNKRVRQGMIWSRLCVNQRNAGNIGVNQYLSANLH